MAVVGYMRISEDEVVPGRQEDDLNVAACERIYVDHVTGVRGRREQLSAAVASLREGDVFVVTRLDRLGGTVAEVVELMAELDRRGVAFRSLEDGIDELGASGRFFFRAAVSLADHERTVQAEPARALEKRRQEARARRRGRAALSRHRLQIARDMLADDAPLADVARHLGVPVRQLREGLDADTAQLDDDGGDRSGRRPRA